MGSGTSTSSSRSCNCGSCAAAGTSLTGLMGIPSVEKMATASLQSAGGKPGLQACFDHLPGFGAVRLALESWVALPVSSINSVAEPRPDIVAHRGNQHPAIAALIGVGQTLPIAGPLRHAPRAQIRGTLNFCHTKACVGKTHVDTLPLARQLAFLEGREGLRSCHVRP